MDPALLGENLRRNRLARARLRQAQLRRRGELLHGTPPRAAEAEDERADAARRDAGMRLGVAACTTAAAGDSWGLEFAARQVQRRANQVGTAEYSVTYMYFRVFVIG
jgi:hypothetical protein